ncbi:MAG: methyltransferase domain-containing protein [Elusimicrobia bacterium]|nr:methyltransferase domain-containing protein [Elusimicrobiota bacterium]MBD3411651.1 methyltransferase domain-containing protein [Elusimicrobiota bacterium]
MDQLNSMWHTMRDHVSIHLPGLDKQTSETSSLIDRIYKYYYLKFLSILDPLIFNGPMIELGSGKGYLKKYLPAIITSEVRQLPGNDLVMNAQDLGLASSSVSVFFLLNVFHHIPDTDSFLKEVERCLKPGGVLVMIEPAFTRWVFLARKIFSENVTKLFCDPSECNIARSWHVFVRHKKKFMLDFPRLIIQRYERFSPLNGQTVLCNKHSFLSSCKRFVLRVLGYLVAPVYMMLGDHVVIEIVKKKP